MKTLLLSILVAIPCIISGQVIYNNYQSNIEICVTANQSKSYDFYIDDLSDDKLMSIHINDNRVFPSLQNIYISCENNFYVGVSSETNPNNFEFGIDIDEQIDWVSNNYMELYRYSLWKNILEWENVSSGFISFAFVTENDTIYGWLRLSTFNSTELNCFKLHDFAYQQNPEDDIYTGESIPQVAEDIEIIDVSDQSDGRDVLLNFYSPVNRIGISEYRAYIVPGDAHETFSLEDAEQIASDRYISISAETDYYSENFEENTVDINGNFISELIPYTVFIMTVGDMIELEQNILSYPSNTLVLTTEAKPVHNLSVTSIYTGGNDYEIHTSFDLPYNTSGISEYRLMFIKNEEILSFDTITANNINPLFYRVLAPDSSYFSAVYTHNILSDINGDALLPEVLYQTCIMSVADMQNANKHAIAVTDTGFYVSSPTSAISSVFAYDDGNNGNASDIRIMFSALEDESCIDSYRVFVVKEEDTEDFSNHTANSINDENKFHIIETGNEFVTTFLPSNLKTVTGELVENDTEYRIFVQTIADMLNTDINALSLKSRKIVISNPDIFKTGQKEGYMVTYFDFEPDSVVLTPSEYFIKNFFDLDFTGDEDTDARISIYNNPEAHGESFYIDIECHENTLVQVSESNNQNADAVPEKYMISSANNFSGNSIRMVHQIGGWFGSGIFGMWYNAQDKYLCFITEELGIQYKAWVKLSIFNASKITIKEYAVQKIISNIGTDNDDFVQVFPNPSSGIINIVGKGLSKEIEIEVYDIQGRKVFSHKANDSMVTINLSLLKSGLYILMIKTDDNFLNKKILLNTN